MTKSSRVRDFYKSLILDIVLEIGGTLDEKTDG
jgi:hypothetical protein